MNPWASRVSYPLIHKTKKCLFQFSIVVCCLTLCGAVFSTILLPDSLAVLRIVLDIVNIIAGVSDSLFKFYNI